jgi:hypothetical protein
VCYKAILDHRLPPGQRRAVERPDLLAGRSNRLSGGVLLLAYSSENKRAPAATSNACAIR